MAITRKPKIQASDIEMGNRTLEAVLMDVAERSARAEERSARAEERSARAEERSARAEERSAQAEERSAIALETISSLLRDFLAFAGRTEGRLDTIEKAAGG